MVHCELSQRAVNWLTFNSLGAGTDPQLVSCVGQVDLVSLFFQFEQLIVAVDLICDDRDLG